MHSFKLSSYNWLSKTQPITSGVNIALHMHCLFLLQEGPQAYPISRDKGRGYFKGQSPKKRPASGTRAAHSVLRLCNQTIKRTTKALRAEATESIWRYSLLHNLWEREKQVFQKYQLPVVGMKAVGSVLSRFCSYKIQSVLEETVPLDEPKTFCREVWDSHALFTFATKTQCVIVWRF